MKTPARLLVPFLLIISILVGTHSAYADDFAKAYDAAVKGDLSSALNFWTNYLKKNPKSYDALINRGLAYVSTGQIKKAVGDWHQARRFAPPFAYACYTPSFLRKSDTSMLGFVYSIEIDPDYVPSILMLGGLYQEMGRRDLAIDLFSKSIELTRNPLLKSRFEHWISLMEKSGEWNAQD